MSESPQNWPFIILFFACFLVFTAAEIVWLKRAAAADFRRVFLVASASNVLAITLGFFLSFLTTGILFAIAFDTSLEGKGMREIVLWTVAVLAIIFPIALLSVAKRLLLYVTGLSGSVARPWSYAALAAILFHVFVLGVPSLVVYLT